MTNLDKVIINKEIIMNNKETEKNTQDNKQAERAQAQAAQEKEAEAKEQEMEEQEAKIEKMMSDIDAKMEAIEAEIEEKEALIESGSPEGQQMELISNVSNISAGLVLSVIGVVLLMKARKIVGKTKKKIVGWILLGFGVATIGFYVAQLFI